MDAIKLNVARRAYSSLDGDSSRAAHDAPESHGGADAKYLKSIVYGGLDGIITTFAVVASIAGAGLDTGIVIIMGFASLIADGISMGMGDYLSSKAEVDYAMEERRREEWECDNYIEGEKKEMVELYKKKGLSHDDAAALIDIMSRYTDVFVDCMMVEELGIMPVDANESPFKNGLVTFTSFLIFGFVPMGAYVVAVAVGETRQIASFDVTFIIASIMTLLTMFGLGAYTVCKALTVPLLTSDQAKFSIAKWWKSGLWMVANGGAAALAAYLVGWGLALLTGEGVAM